jgi:hypothetical protein
MSGEPGVAVQAIFSSLIETIKNQGTAANPGTLGTGFFLELVLGMPVLYQDYGDRFVPKLDDTLDHRWRSHSA